MRLRRPDSTTNTKTIENRSSSMEPLIHCARPGQGCEARQDDSVAVRVPPDRLRRGDIVIFRAPQLAAFECGAAGFYLKRLIALPGDRWSERRGVVYINGKRLAEPYVRPDRRDPRTLTLKDIPPRGTLSKVPHRMYLVLGDNRRSSCDSRVFGLVPRANIIGRVVHVLHPSS